jgi:hypothetical protein
MESRFNAVGPVKGRRVVPGPNVPEHASCFNAVGPVKGRRVCEKKFEIRTPQFCFNAVGPVKGRRGGTRDEAQIWPAEARIDSWFLQL